MQTYHFKTNINCENSIRTLQLFIEKHSEIKSWSVDTSQAHYPLSIQTTSLQKEDIIQMVEKAGFKIEEIPME